MITQRVEPSRPHRPRKASAMVILADTIFSFLVYTALSILLAFLVRCDSRILRLLGPCFNGYHETSQSIFVFPTGSILGLWILRSIFRWGRHLQCVVGSLWRHVVEGLTWLLPVTVGPYEKCPCCCVGIPEEPMDFEDLGSHTGKHEEEGNDMVIVSKEEDDSEQRYGNIGLML